MVAPGRARPATPVPRPDLARALGGGAARGVQRGSSPDRCARPPRRRPRPARHRPAQRSAHRPGRRPDGARLVPVPRPARGRPHRVVGGRRRPGCLLPADRGAQRDRHRAVPRIRHRASRVLSARPVRRGGPWSGVCAPRRPARIVASANDGRPVPRCAVGARGRIHRREPGTWQRRSGCRPLPGGWATRSQPRNIAHSCVRCSGCVASGWTARRDGGAARGRRRDSRVACRTRRIRRGRLRSGRRPRRERATPRGRTTLARSQPHTRAFAPGHRVEPARARTPTQQRTGEPAGRRAGSRARLCLCPAHAAVSRPGPLTCPS